MDEKEKNNESLFSFDGDAPAAGGEQLNSVGGDDIPNLASVLGDLEEEDEKRTDVAVAVSRPAEEEKPAPPIEEVPTPQTAVPPEAKKVASAAAEAAGSAKEEKKPDNPPAAPASPAIPAVSKKAAAKKASTEVHHEPIPAGKVIVSGRYNELNFLGGLSFGHIFSDLRKMNNLSIEQLAGETKIRSTYIEAIEKEDLDTLPPLIYIIAYLRQLAKFYNLSGEASDLITGELRKNLSYESPENVSKHIVDSEKSEENERKLRKLLVLIISCGVAALLGIGVLIYFLAAGFSKKISQADAAAVPVGYGEILNVAGPASIKPAATNLKR